MKTYLDGLKFGMLLQIAIGPMCLMVFSTAQNAGFPHAMAFVLAVTLVDAFYIALAALGISRLLENENRKKALRLIGGLVLIAALWGASRHFGWFEGEVSEQEPVDTFVYDENVPVDLENKTFILSTCLQQQDLHLHSVSKA